MFVTTTRRPLIDDQPSASQFRPGRGVQRVGRSSPRRTAPSRPRGFHACDVFEDKDAVKIVAEVPGVRPGDVKISIEHNVLTVRGEKKQQAEEKTERVHRYERSYGSFERSFSLPSSVDPERIAASYVHGILTVTIPKAERARPREIPVKVA